MGHSRTATVLATTAVVAVIAAPAAVADGPPVGGVDASLTGVGSLDGTDRFVTIASPTGTTVARVAQEGGRIQQTRFLRGSFTIPAVANDGSASGLSADGSRLVLITPRPGFPRARTTFAVLNADRLGPPRIERLPGDFSFDAISPDGRWMYLIHYIAPRDPSRYEVRAYDLEAHRLIPGAIVDSREPDEKMAGLPVTRAVSPDGRWAYTLYNRVDGTAPFIHALDTSTRTARCIDLDLIGPSAFPGGTAELAVDPDGRRVTVEVGTIPKAVVDLTTFEVTSPAAGTSAPTEPAGSDATNPWPLVGGGVLAALVAAGGIRRLRRERPHQAA